LADFKAGLRCADVHAGLRNVDPNSSTLTPLADTRIVAMAANLASLDVGSQTAWRIAVLLPAGLQNSHQNGGAVFLIFVADPITVRLYPMSNTFSVPTQSSRPSHAGTPTGVIADRRSGVKNAVSHYIPPPSTLTSTAPQSFSNDVTLPMQPHRVPDDLDRIPIGFLSCRDRHNDQLAAPHQGQQLDDAPQTQRHQRRPNLWAAPRFSDCGFRVDLRREV
jgi:hypothetical protein